ncbi:ATP-binding cassette domain-containing protein [Acidovorax sp. SUPP3334]|uniref:ABC transporter ATP-binding protein n=1 Tax=Acidovorax sp. SUPP3334 TaxID=2920881 RepID=UPI0023DE6642|nr:ATP-binding cassette domain-containing protein [Acidovorax sp. SUPP3334]GKT20690.1 ATP-binding cassette domain-containing protein [Acidovorax sp. SUPP3334]
MQALLRAENLGFSTPLGRQLVRGVDACVAPGECVALVGPNGAGKSTLLKLLSARAAPTQGRVCVLGHDLTEWPALERARHVAVLAQTESVDLAFKVRDYVALGRLPHQAHAGRDEHARVVDEAMQTCGVEGFAQRALSTLSGGERQRVHLARALAQQPALLLLDEPTNHLDLAARADLLALVRGLRIAVVAALHELGLVPSFADRVWMLQAGALVADGPPGQALSAGRVADVFGMELVHTQHPRHGGTLWSFERGAVA